MIHKGHRLFYVLSFGECFDLPADICTANKQHACNAGAWTHSLSFTTPHHTTQIIFTLRIIAHTGILASRHVVSDGSLFCISFTILRIRILRFEDKRESGLIDVNKQNSNLCERDAVFRCTLNLYSSLRVCHF